METNNSNGFLCTLHRYWSKIQSSFHLQDPATQKKGRTSTRILKLWQGGTHSKVYSIAFQTAGEGPQEGHEIDFLSQDSHCSSPL